MNTAKKIIALAHKALLASVGIQGRGREIAANKLDQLFVNGSVLANELLRKGASLEAQLQAKESASAHKQEKNTAQKAGAWLVATKTPVIQSIHNEYT